MFARTPTLAIDVIMGAPTAALPVTAEQFAHQTVERLQLAYELARQNTDELAEAYTARYAGKKLLQFQPGDLVLVHQPPQFRG